MQEWKTKIMQNTKLRLVLPLIITLLLIHNEVNAMTCIGWPGGITILNFIKFTAFC